MNKRNACKYFQIVLMLVLLIGMMGIGACTAPVATPVPSPTSQPTVRVTVVPPAMTTAALPRPTIVPTTTAPATTVKPATTAQPPTTTTAAPRTMTTSAPTPIAAPSNISPSDITGSPSIYDGKEIEVIGQAYLAGGQSKLLVDGISGINLSGSLGTLQNGYYRMKGVYSSLTNTLNVSQFIGEQVTAGAIQVAQALGLKLAPVSVTGLVATVPQEVSDKINSYISIPSITGVLTIYPYVIFTQDALYLALFSSPIQMPTKFTFGNIAITLSAGELIGTLVKTPLQNISFGSNWLPGEFGGVILANSVAPLNPISATVQDINSNPSNYIFKRVSINDASYVVATAAITPFSLNSQMNIPIGLGLMFDKFPDLFQDGPDKVINSSLLTLNPESTTCQLRRGQVTGTLIGPTPAISKFFLNKLPGGGPGFLNKPALIVDDTPTGQIISTTIDQLNPFNGNPSQYWGKVVQFEGYAAEFPVSIRQALSEVAPFLANSPIDIDLQVICINANLIELPPPDLIIIGFSNQLSNLPQLGKYKFTVAVSQMPNSPVSLPPGFPKQLAQTAFFLLNKEPISAVAQPIIKIQNVDMPTTVTVGQTYNYTVTLINSGSSQATVALNITSSVTGNILTQSITVPANGSINVPITTTFASAGVRTITYSVIYNNQVLDSLSITVQANNLAIITVPTTMSFTVSGGPFGYKTLTSYLDQGQRVAVFFTIVGGNNDIYVYAYDPSNAVVAGSKSSRYYTSGQFSFTASVSGSYSLNFDNTFSVLTSKNVQVTVTGGQWK